MTKHVCCRLIVDCLLSCFSTEDARISRKKVSQPILSYLKGFDCFVVTPSVFDLSTAQSVSAPVQHRRGEAAEAPAHQKQRWKWVIRRTPRRVLLEGWGNSDILTFLWCLFWFVFPVLIKVYCCDNTYTTIRASVAASVAELIRALAEKLGSAEDLLLVSLGSAGGGSGSRDTRSQSWRQSFY